MLEDVALSFGRAVWMVKNPERSTNYMDIFGFDSRKQVISGKGAFGGAGRS